jgi:hypothetical protein
MVCRDLLAVAGNVPLHLPELSAAPAFHRLCVALRIARWIVASMTGWINSVAYVSHLSQAALVLGSWSAWQATRVEAQQDER